MDILSAYDNMNVMLGDESYNSIKKELDYVIDGTDKHQDYETLPNRGSSSQENEIRSIDNRNGTC